MAKPSASLLRLQGRDRDRVARLWSGYIWPQKRRLFSAFFFMTTLALATAGYGFLVKYIIDTALVMVGETDAATNAMRYAAAIVPILIAVTAVSGLSMYMQRVLANALALNVVAELQKQMFRSAHEADFAMFAREQVGNLISRFTNDVTVLTQALIRTVSNLFRDTLTILFLFISMFIINWRLSLLILVVYPLAAWPIIQITKRLRGSATDVQEHVGQMTSDLKESFTGARLVRTYNLADNETTRLGRSFDERIRLYLKMVSEQARVDPILEVMGGLAIAGVFVFGVYQVTAGQASAGDIGGVLTLLLAASPRIRALGTLNTVVQEGLAALTRIFHIVDETPTIIDQKNASDLQVTAGEIVFKDVHFAYPDGTEALIGINMTAKPNHTVALVGASGSGKSTIINLIPRLYEVTGGAIMIDGQDIRQVSLASLRRSIALVSQDIVLFNDTVAANIGFGDLDAKRDAIIDAAKAADAHEFIERLPKGYDTIIGEAGDLLSGGQKQRLAIARAVLRDAPILLLDEATSALDAASEAKVQAALERLSKGRTTLVIAHRLATVQTADQIFVMDAGKIIETGTHDTLSRTSSGVYAKLSALQFAG